METRKELVALPQQPSPLSGTTSTIQRQLSEIEERLRPAGAQTGIAELTSCLILVAPSGWSEDDRNEWLKVARETLRGIPADLLVRGCKAARMKADHPSKIVSAITKEVGEAWAMRRRAAAELRETLELRKAPRLEQPDYVKPEEAAAILEQFGLKSKQGDEE